MTAARAGADTSRHTVLNEFPSDLSHSSFRIPQFRSILIRIT